MYIARFTVIHILRSTEIHKGYYTVYEGHAANTIRPQTWSPCYFSDQILYYLETERSVSRLYYRNNEMPVCTLVAYSEKLYRKICIIMRAIKITFQRCIYFSAFSARDPSATLLWSFCTNSGFGRFLRWVSIENPTVYRLACSDLPIPVTWTRHSPQSPPPPPPRRPPASFLLFHPAEHCNKMWKEADSPP